MKPIPHAISLAPSLAIILAALVAAVQTRASEAAANATVSAAEVEAFMRDIRQVTNGAVQSYMNIPANPQRVLLLLGAIEREPASPEALLLQGFCFGVGPAGAFRLPPTRRLEVYARASEYLATTKAMVSKALQANP